MKSPAMKTVVAAVIERGDPSYPHWPAPQTRFPHPENGISRRKMEEGETPEAGSRSANSARNFAQH